MAVDQKQKFCPDCERKTLHQRQRLSEAVGCFLTLLTAGLFLPIWILMSLVGTAQGYYCQVCGRRN
jgi:hypothetical protein